ncbi:hypothetical protein AAC387_Pa03g0019 [Persea americana]
MEFLKVKKFRSPRKLDEEKGPVVAETPREESKDENGTDGLKTNAAVDSAGEAEEYDDDDDFITQEVKRQLKELRNKRFLVLIPEESESCPEDEDEAEDENGTGSSDWKESMVEGGSQWCGGFGSFYDKYCERMLFFDKMSFQLLQDGSGIPSNPSPRSASKKLASTLRSLSFKRREGLQGDGEHPQQPLDDPLQDLETAYVAQLCLTWEALHCQYAELCQKISVYPENPTWCSLAAQKFQQFQVLLHRFIENEPFEQGNRVEIFSRSRISLPKLLQVPSFRESDQKQLEEGHIDTPVLANDLFGIIENSIMTFCLFLKMDKKKSGSALHIFGAHGQAQSYLQQTLTALDKKKIKLKELQRKKKGWKKKSWPPTAEEVELFFALIDIKVMSRVLKMTKISKEQLLWCEEKMSKLDFSGSKLQRNGSPLLFPC